MMCLFFFWIFSSLLITSSFLVITAKNPVYCVLFLILSFFNLSLLLFLLNLEFLPIIGLIVYIGAIAVLFLFVVMLLNIKLSSNKRQEFSIIGVFSFLSFLFISEFLLLFKLEVSFLMVFLDNINLFSDLSNRSYFFLSSELFYIQETNLRSIGQVLFSEFWLQFLIIGYALLFSMISTIVLALGKTFFSKNQNPYFQTLKNFESVVVTYK